MKKLFVNQPTHFHTVRRRGRPGFSVADTKKPKVKYCWERLSFVQTSCVVTVLLQLGL